MRSQSGTSTTTAACLPHSGRQVAGGGSSDGTAGRRYRWHAGGLLAEVWRGDNKLASYRYNHRGERIEKRSTSGTSYFLYENRKITAELDAEGRLVRQYIYLGDSPVAVVDRRDGAQAPAVLRGILAQTATDVARAVREWIGGGTRLAFPSTTISAPPRQ